MKKNLEICCYTLESAITAEKFGADRIELCDNHSEGGTTPSYATIQLAIEKLKIPVNVIIRPRGGDFLYSELEYEIIKKDVIKIKELQAIGIVIGFLHTNGEIDIERTREIVELAKPMEVTFHRAFDMCKNPMKALEQLKKIGITRILTSGAKNTAMEGIFLLSELVNIAGDDIIIMPGSGLNETNLHEIMETTHAMEFHSSAKKFESNIMEFFNQHISMGGDSAIDEFKKIAADGEKIKKMIEILK